jgi:hypothetical protein
MQSQSQPRLTAYLIGLLLLTLTVTRMEAQMVSPDIDKPGEPFSYPSQPTDEIGVMYSPSAAEITPEGYIYTGFGELMFFTGPDHQPVVQRVRTLVNGYLPIVNYDVSRYGMSYHWEMFAAAVGQDGAVMNFVCVTATNSGAKKATAFITTAVRYQGPSNHASETGDNRFSRPVTSQEIGDYQQPGEIFDADWQYGFNGNAFVRNGKVLYLFPTSPAPELGLTLKGEYSKSPNQNLHRLDIQTTTPTGVASYTFVVQPGEHKSLDFVMPLLPVDTTSALLPALRIVNYDQYRQQTMQTWQKIVSSGMKISLPERKVVDTFNASLVYDLMALNKIGDDYVQTVNQLHYHGFYLRDSADIIRMYDATGYAQIAGRVLKFDLTKQKPDGNFLSQAGQYDGWGQTLYIFGEHYRMTHDQSFAEMVYPSIVKAVAWFEKATANDPLHLMPSTDVRDNEYVPGHLTGYNFLALDGLQGAKTIALGLGHKDDAKRFANDYDVFRKNFLARLDIVTANTGGYIPPDMDGNTQGTDWGNLLSVTPEEQLDPHDKKVTATLHETQSRYQEGIMTYGQGEWLHHYLTIKNTQTEVVRGDQEQALRELYALLLHTSATQAGFEFSVRPWGDRDFGGNLNPHGWFAAEYRNLLRNMLVREEGDKLHVLSVSAPEWIGGNKTISVENVPTFFGSVSYALISHGDGAATLNFKNHFGAVPAVLIVHLPWFLTLISAEVDGKRISAQDGTLQLPATAEHVELKWRKRNTHPMSYTVTVANYKTEYRRRFNELIQDGTFFDWHSPAQK